MKKIDGTATISIETLDELREREQWYKGEINVERTETKKQKLTE